MISQISKLLQQLHWQSSRTWQCEKPLFRSSTVLNRLVRAECLSNYPLCLLSRSVVEIPIHSVMLWGGGTQIMTVEPSGMTAGLLQQDRAKVWLLPVLHSSHLACCLTQGIFSINISWMTRQHKSASIVMWGFSLHIPPRGLGPRFSLLYLSQTYSSSALIKTSLLTSDIID